MWTSHRIKRIKDILRIIYSRETSDDVFRELKNLMELYARDETVVEKRKKYNDHVVLNEEDAILITYADNITREGEKPLRTLHRFLTRHVQDAVTGVHILPFYPSSSDGGYAVMDFKEVDPQFGTWEDVRTIARDYRVMADLVINHVSSKSGWFQGFLQGDRRYRDYFIWSEKRPDMPDVFRPREHPLFTEFESHTGRKYVWTTFSEDQVDLNYRNPDVLLKMIEVLLFYLSQGIEMIRLDAIGYVWKESHSSCVNLSKTHQIVKLIRTILECVAPYAVILTEANFPYKDNVAYFGEGHEANMVYNFALPPLVIDAFIRKNTSCLQVETRKIRQNLMFFNFLASHDGIGLLSAKQILPQKNFEDLLRTTLEHQGRISYKTSLSEGRKPYELNISYFDAINDPEHPVSATDVKRFVASQAILLADKGIPGIYFHSLLGSRNFLDGVKETGINRMINREKLHEDDLNAALADDNTIQHQVFERLLHLLKVRRQCPLFHHRVRKKVVDLDKRLYSITRRDEQGGLLVAINVSDDTLELETYKGKLDLVTGSRFTGKAEPYGIYFLK